MNVAVLGGGGYIGSRMVRRLLRNGHNVSVLDTFYWGEDILSEHFDHPNFSYKVGDIRTVNKKFFKKVDVVMDFAAICNDPSCDLDPKLTASINIDGVIHAATMAKAAGVKRYLFSSSASVYGFSERKNLKENAKLNPISQYAKAKVLVEQALLKMKSKLFCVTCLRNSTVFGYSKRMRLDLVVNIMALRGWQTSKISVYGGGEQLRPNVHIEDVCRAFEFIMNSNVKNVNGECYNVGGQSCSIKEVALLVSLMLKMLGREVEIIEVDNSPDTRSYHLSFDKLNRLGFKAEGDIGQGVLDVINNLESDNWKENDKCYSVKHYKKLLKDGQIKF